MTALIANVAQSTDSFGQWIDKTNQAITVIRDKTVTTDSNTAVGNAGITGTLSSSNVYVSNSGFYKIGIGSSNAFLSKTQLMIQSSATVNTIITDSGMYLSGTAYYTDTVMSIGNSSVRAASINVDSLVLQNTLRLGNTYLSTNNANTNYIYATYNLWVGDVEANTTINRDGLQILRNPTYPSGFANARMTHDSLWIKNVYANTGTFNYIDFANDGIFRGNTWFQGANNYFNRGLTSNGNIVINGKANPVHASLTVRSDTFAGINIVGDQLNTATEVGGAYVSFYLDGGEPDGLPTGVISKVNVANRNGLSGTNSSYMGTLADSLLVGTLAAHSLHLGTANTVKVTVTPEGAIGIRNSAGSVEYGATGEVLVSKGSALPPEWTDFYDTYGFSGSRGATGFVGSQGIQGNVGFVGSRGVEGVQGVVGFVGSRGVTGFSGSVGTTGFTGSIGITPDLSGLAFPTGTRLLFQQDNAPAGWTKITSYDNRALRVVSGTAGTGGSIPFTTAFASRNINGTVGGTALTIAQMPSHNHTGFGVAYADGTSGYGNASTTMHNYNGDQGQVFRSAGVLVHEDGGHTKKGSTTSRSLGPDNYLFIDNKGGGDSHTHTFTGTDLNLDVQYVDIIIARRD